MHEIKTYLNFWRFSMAFYSATEAARLTTESPARSDAPAPRQLVVVSPDIVKLWGGATIQEMQTLQAKACALAATDKALCVRTIQELVDDILRAEEEWRIHKKDEKSVSKLTSDALGFPGISAEKCPPVADLSTRTVDLDQENTSLRSDKRETISFLGDLAKTAAAENTALCLTIIQKLGESALKIAQARDALVRAKEKSFLTTSSNGTPTQSRSNNPSNDPELARMIRITYLLKECFGHLKLFLELPNREKEFHKLIFSADPTMTVDQIYSALSGLKIKWEQDFNQRDEKDGGVSALEKELRQADQDTRKLTNRYDALLTLWNDRIASRWKIESMEFFLLEMLGLQSREYLLAKEVAVLPAQAANLQKYQTRASDYKKQFEAFQAQLTELRTKQPLPNLKGFNTYGSALQLPVTTDRAAPEFDNLKPENVQAPLIAFSASVRERADQICKEILDCRITTGILLLEKQGKPPLAELPQSLQVDLDARLSFLTSDIAALGTTPNGDRLKTLTRQLDDLKSVYGRLQTVMSTTYETPVKLPTKFSEDLNSAVVQIRARHVDLLASEFAAKVHAKTAELRAGLDLLKQQVAECRKDPKFDLDEGEVATLSSKVRGKENAATFEGQFSKLVDLKFNDIKTLLDATYPGDPNAWLKEDKERCHFAPEQEAVLVRKLQAQYTLSKTEFEKRHAVLTTEWTALDSEVRTFTKSLNIVEDAIRAKGFKPEAEKAQESWMPTKCCTRYTQWWNRGQTEAPKVRAPAAAPAKSSPPASPNASVVGNSPPAEK